MLFVQNLFHLALPPAHGTNLVAGHRGAVLLRLGSAGARAARSVDAGCALLVAALIASPLFRRTHLRWITPTHTLIHLDGIALGSLLALGLYTLRSAAAYLALDRPARSFIGFIAAATIAGGTAFLDYGARRRLRRRGARLHRVHRRAQPAHTRSSAAALWLSMAASATAST